MVWQLPNATSGTAALTAFNLRLETSESLLRCKEGDEAVDRAVRV